MFGETAINNCFFEIYHHTPQAPRAKTTSWTQGKANTTIWVPRVEMGGLEENWARGFKTSFKGGGETEKDAPF